MCVIGSLGFVNFFVVGDNGNGNWFRCEEMWVCVGDDGGGVM